MTSETNARKPWSARKWGWLFVGLFLFSLAMVVWSAGDFAVNHVSFFYNLDHERSKNRILELHTGYTIAALIPVIISPFVWVGTAICLWRALKKQQQAQPVITLDPQLGEKFRRDPASFDSTDVKPQ